MTNSKSQRFCLLVLISIIPLFFSCSSQPQKQIEPKSQIHLTQAEIVYEQTLQNLQESQYTQALESLRQAISIPDPFGVATLKIFRIVSVLNNTDEAQKIYEAVIAKNPQDEVAHYLLSVIAIKKSDKEKALSEVQKAIAINPKFYQAYINLGAINSLLGKTDEAIKAFQTAIATKPDFVIAHLSLGSTLSFSGKSQEALKAFLAVVKLNPKNSDFYEVIAGQMSKLEMSEEVLKACQKILTTQPENGLAYFVMGVVDQLTSKPLDAIKAFELARKKEPDLFAVSKHLAKSYALNNDLPNAIKASEAAIAKDDQNAEAYFLKAQYLQDSGHEAEAIGAYQSAVRLDPNKLEVVLSQAVFLIMSGDQQGVQKVLEVAKKITPQAPHTYFRIAQIYEKSQNHQKAKEHFVLALKYWDEAIAKDAQFFNKNPEAKREYELAKKESQNAERTPSP